jgi:hypothetical protein
MRVLVVAYRLHSTSLFVQLYMLLFSRLSEVAAALLLTACSGRKKEGETALRLALVWPVIRLLACGLSCQSRRILVKTGLGHSKTHICLSSRLSNIDEMLHDANPPSLAYSHRLQRIIMLDSLRLSLVVAAYPFSLRGLLYVDGILMGSWLHGEPKLDKFSMPEGLF